MNDVIKYLYISFLISETDGAKRADLFDAIVGGDEAKIYHEYFRFLIKWSNL